MDVSLTNCKELPRRERNKCRRKEREKLQRYWIQELLNPDTPGREAWQVQLWLGIFPISWRQLGNRTALLYKTISTIQAQLRNSYVDLLQAMLLDPALQISLNGLANHWRKPNENLARELLELFSLGIGNYSESDVQEAARALTGYRLKDGGRIEMVLRRHDPGPHIILGRTESFDAISLASWLGQQPSTARHVVKRVWRSCTGVVPSQNRLEELSNTWLKKQLSIPWLMTQLQESPEALNSRSDGLRLLDPIELVVRSLQLLGSDHPDAVEISLRGLKSMGQELFAPPSVKGWPVNEEWLQLRWLQARRLTLQKLLADEEIWDSSQLPSTLQVSNTSFPPLSLQLPTTATRETVGDLFADPSWQIGLSPVLR